MSFSQEVKEELSRHIPGARHCQLAELARPGQLFVQIDYKRQRNGFNFGDGKPADSEKILYFIK